MLSMLFYKIVNYALLYCANAMLETCQQIRLSDLLMPWKRGNFLMRNLFMSLLYFNSCHFILKKVIEWIKTEGENSLIKYCALSLECGNTIRDEEQEFEKYYFISMVSC